MFGRGAQLFEATQQLQRVLVLDAEGVPLAEGIPLIEGVPLTERVSVSCGRAFASESWRRRRRRRRRKGQREREK